MELRHTQKVWKPIGKLEGINLAIEDMSPKDLNAYDILESKTVKLEFEGGIMLKVKCYRFQKLTRRNHADSL
jgi:phenylalanine-4-hydroxylase